MYVRVMIHESTPGKWSLWATHPRRLGGIAEWFATEASANARADELRRAGYFAEAFLSHPDRRQGNVAAAAPALLRHR